MLDEQQQRYIEDNESARRLSQTFDIAEAHSDYRFKYLSVDELRAALDYLAHRARGYEARRLCPTRCSQREILDARSDDDL